MQAGAKHVYAVDPSGITAQAAKLAAAAGLSSRITVLRSRVEDVQLPVAKVDVILSEWAGHCLLLDSLAPAVLAARDRWLAPGGAIFPNKASLRLLGVDDREQLAAQQRFWKDVAGVNMSGAMTQARGLTTSLQLFWIRPAQMTEMLCWCNLSIPSIGVCNTAGAGMMARFL